MGKIIRYNRVSTTSQDLSHYRKDDDDKRYDLVLEDKESGYSKSLFERKYGSILKEMILEGQVDEISIYSVDRISRSINELTELIKFLHENNVCLSIENLGVKSLVDNKETPTIMFLIYLQGCFAELNYWDRREKQMLGVEKAKILGKYKNRKTRSNVPIEKWLEKPKIRKAVSFLRENPNMNNSDLSKLCDLHHHTIRKIRNVCDIPKVKMVA